MTSCKGIDLRMAINGEVWYAEVSKRKQTHLVFPSLCTCSVILGLEKGKGTTDCCIPISLNKNQCSFSASKWLCAKKYSITSLATWVPKSRGRTTDLNQRTMMSSLGMELDKMGDSREGGRVQRGEE